MKHLHPILICFAIYMLALPSVSSAQGAMAGFGRKDKTSSVTGAAKRVFFYVRGCDTMDPQNITDGKGNVVLFHDELYIDIKNTNGNYISASDIEFFENKSGFRDIDGEPYIATLDLDPNEDIGTPIPDAIFFQDLDTSKASVISFYRTPNEAINIIVSYKEVFREEIFQICDSGDECLNDYTLDVRKVIGENCLNPLNIENISRNIFLAFQNRLVITLRNSKGDFPESPCLELREIESGFRNDLLELIREKTFESDSLDFVYYRRGGEVTDLSINKVRFIIPNTTEFCAQNTPCVKADLDLPYLAQDSFQSSRTIITSAHLPQDMKLFLQAKTAVELIEGFQVDTSNRFKVIMEDCTPPTTGN